MARLSYLERRGATYYARHDIPLDLRPILGTSCRKKSLGTKEERVAKARLWPVIAAWQAEFEELRARREITEDDKAAAPWEAYMAALERDEQARAHYPTPDAIQAATEAARARVRAEKIDPSNPLAALDVAVDVLALRNHAKHDAHARTVRLTELRHHMMQNITVLVDHEVEDFLQRHNLIAERGTRDYLDLARRIMRAEIEALERTVERDRGDYSGRPSDPIVSPITGKRTTVRPIPGEAITELFETYAAENPRSIAADTLAQARRDVGHFAWLFGTSFPVSRIDRPHVREWKQVLLQWPVKATETAAFRGMNPRQVIEANKALGKPTINPRTVNRYIAGMSAFCQWLVVEGHLDANPVTGLALRPEKTRTTRPLTVDQMQTLFVSPLFTGCLDAGTLAGLATAGDARVRDHRYWLPLMMPFSGARPAELAQLDLADVREEHGIWIMHVHGDGADKSVKTEGSARVVPVHSELIRLGLLNHHAAMKAKGETRLFPEAARNSRGQMIADFSRVFSRYLERIGIREGRGLSLYSFRHGAADALRRAGHLDEQFGFLLGHAKATMTQRYGVLGQGALSLRKDLVESIAYPGLDLLHLCSR